ncbi:class A basic helix-loop-helix protein 15 isoform X1 [Amphiprion ocellaris]|uniref:class A basic helix-loop-helix protein 15 isoform X1 n=1 Tax=Amphiprion ocellaris TaxID=80972 RepID=UPI002410EAAD|nr:class A basic helix-loop-helix protein 15 isoform X1 [Amphiprion ocellaris]XP_054860203.1 class A basic helix-loop-helix protein 15 isoform X1 [Amphiprion ocellaris]
MTQADEERQPVTCFCILDQRESSTFKSWRNTDCKSSSLCLSPRHCCLLKKCIHRSTFTSMHPFVTDFPKEVAWTKLILNMRDIIGLITKYLNMATQQDTVTVHPNKKCVMFFDDFIPARLFSDLYFTQNCRIFLGHTGSHTNDNMSVDSKYSPTYCHLDPNTNSEDDHSETDISDKVNLRSLLKSCQSYNHLGESSGRCRKVKLRKSVSFDDDVMVYLFDKESPTLELHSESCTSLPSSNSCNLPAVTLDSGLEWEDDFSALEKNCHFQHSMPKQSWTSLPGTERCSLSQKCLFLTYVTESDLEL